LSKYLTNLPYYFLRLICDSKEYLKFKKYYYKVYPDIIALLICCEIIIENRKMSSLKERLPKIDCKYKFYNLKHSFDPKINYLSYIGAIKIE